jgi:hypothetical protein
MKAFYLIHAAMVLEVVLVILSVLKLYDFILKIKALERKIKVKTALKVNEIQLFREKIQNFNQKCEEKMNYAHNIFDFTVNIVKKLAMQGVLAKFYFPKKGFFAKILDYKATIFWFLLSFFFFRNKKA